MYPGSHFIYYGQGFIEIGFCGQERAYMMLRMDIANGSDYGSWEAESYGHEDEADDDDYDDASEEDYDGSDVEVDDDAEDAFDVHAHAEEAESDNQNAELDPSAYSSDEAYARALQDAEEREMAARLLALAGINGSESLTGHILVLRFLNYSFYDVLVL